MHASCEVSGLMAESHRLLEHLFETRVPCLEVVVLQLHSQSSFQSQDHMCEIEKDIVSSNDDTHRVVSQGGSRYGHFGNPSVSLRAWTPRLRSFAPFSVRRHLILWFHNGPASFSKLFSNHVDLVSHTLHCFVRKSEKSRHYNVHVSSRYKSAMSGCVL